MLAPAGFVYLASGLYLGEATADVVDRKRKDIEEHGYCLWAYAPGAAGPDRVRRLVDMVDGEVEVIMCDTGGDPKGQGLTYTGFAEERAGPVTRLPDGMSPVTSTKNAIAVVLGGLAWAERGTSIDVAAYDAPFADGGPQPFDRHRRAVHGKGCAIRSDSGRTPRPIPVDIVGSLVPPYAVHLVA